VRTGPAPQPTPAAPARPDWLPETFSQPQDFRAAYDELAAWKAGLEVKRATLPSKADDYKAELPADFKMPDGVKFEFNAADPLLHQARAVMHDIDQGKLSGQEAFGKLLALYAGGQVASEQQIKAGRNAEIQKLGAAGPARIDALTTFFRAYLGDAAGSRRMTRIFTAQDVQDAEMEVSKIVSQGGASYRGNGREPPERAGHVSAEQYQKMSARERLDYNRQFDQTKMPSWRDPRA
jgi:hypothetical protein